MTEIILKSQKRTELMDITKHISSALKKSGKSEGAILLYCPHTTAGLTVNENADPSVVRDIESYLKKAVPESRDYTHTEGNSDSHIKSFLTGNSLFLPLEKGKIILGRWQGIFFCEYDGPRERKVYMKIIFEG